MEQGEEKNNGLIDAVYSLWDSEAEKKVFQSLCEIINADHF